MAIGSPQWMYASGEAYELDQSLKFNDDDSAYLSRTFGSSPTSLKTWTLSCWIKRSSTGTTNYVLSYDSGGNPMGILGFNSSNQFHYYDRDASSGSADIALYTTQLFRDPSAWYHFVIKVDTTQGTESNRVKIYLNGLQITAWDTETYPAQNYDTILVGNHYVNISGWGSSPSSSYIDGYLSEVNFIDGQALTPADFGETGDYGEWKPIEYSGTYGTNGFYLPFKQDYTVEGFSTVTWKGSSVDGSYIGGVGFQPDLTWIKNRGQAGSWHFLVDSVRGVSKSLYPNDSYVEVTSDGNGHIDSFEADGMTLAFDDGTNTNSSSWNYVAWNWDMGGSNATNTDGTITSTVRANPTYGQSIVSYTGNGSDGATVGHGLSSTPDMVIVKSRDSVHSWSVGHVGLGTNEVLLLNQTSAKANCTTDFSNGGVGARGATTFTLEAGTVNANNVNTNNEGFIAYCWHSVTGYSKFGSYTGNGNLAGPSVTLGFKPAFVLIRKTNGSTSDWLIFDSTRNPTNEVRSFLEPNTSDAETIEQTTNYELGIDFDSNGFQIKARGGGMNGNGDNYIYMAFADKREYAYWLDQSGNNNDWTSNNLTESDISVDSPTNNFATMNPLSSPTATATLSEGNLKASASSIVNSYATIGMSSGKWYWEAYCEDVGSAMLGIGNDPSATGDTGNYKYYVNGNKYDPSGASSYGASYTTGDIIAFTYDADIGTLTAYKNNVSQGTMFSSLSGTYFPFFRSAGGTPDIVYNFGQDSSFAGNKTAQGNQDSNGIGDFYYTPPTGFLALCTSNLPDVAVTPSEHFNTVLWSGSGSSQSITGVGFQPDWLWIKMRSSAYNHRFFDAIRGSANGLYSPNTNVEGDYSAYDGVTSFDTDGFSLSGKDGTDKSGETYVAWNWKANGSGSSNTNGSINTTATSANVDAGFSIVTYSGNGTAGATIGHGLSKAPEMVIIKSRTNGNDWWDTYHKDIGADKSLFLNDTAAAGSRTYYNNTHPSSSVIYLGSDRSSNGSGETFVAYCFHSVDGYSKVGSYTGSSSADGTFLYTGFKPKFVLLKDVAGGEWGMFDSTRNSYNVVNKQLQADGSSAEYSGDSNRDMDFLSNGIKLRNAAPNGLIFDNSARTYIYIAFAETPFKYSNAR